MNTTQPKTRFQRYMDTLERTFHENPLATLAIAATGLHGLAKVIDAVGSVRSKNAYARTMNASNR